MAHRRTRLMCPKGLWTSLSSFWCEAQRLEGFIEASDALFNYNVD